MAKSTDENEKKNRALLNKKAAEALKDLIAQVEFYRKLMSEDPNLAKNDPKLIALLAEIGTELNDLASKAKENAYVNLEKILSLSNKINAATDKVNTTKFIPSIEAYKQKFGQRLVGLQKAESSPEAKLLENMQARMQSGMMKIEENAKILRNNTKEPSLWKKFTRAVTNFAKSAQNKFMSVIRKTPKSKAPPPPPPPAIKVNVQAQRQEEGGGVRKSHEQELKEAIKPREDRRVLPGLLAKQERDREKEKQKRAQERREEADKAIQVPLKTTPKRSAEEELDDLDRVVGIKPETKSRDRASDRPPNKPLPTLRSRLSVGPPTTPPPLPPGRNAGRALPIPPGTKKGSEGSSTTPPQRPQRKKH